MKLMRKLVMAVCLAVCLNVSMMNVFAADDRLGQVVDGSLLTDETEMEYTVTSLARGTYLSSGSGRISIAGTRKINMNGSTSAYQNVSSISVTLFLQKLVGNNWQDAGVIIGPRTNYNSSYVSVSATKSVPGGYYYRVTGSHAVMQGQNSEAASSYTNGIWVD